MSHHFSNSLPNDRGGRRRIKDRRVRVAAMHTPERRTGLRRRSGWDRRYRPASRFIPADRRSRGLGLFY